MPDPQACASPGDCVAFWKGFEVDNNIHAFLIKENSQKLELCDKPHRFQDKLGLLNTAPLAPIHCEKCAGAVPAVAARWYNLGILHTSDMAQVEIDRLEKELVRNVELRLYAQDMAREFRKAVDQQPGSDEPEGAVRIAFSSTLINQIAEQLQILSQEP